MSPKIKYCLPIIKSTKSEVLATIENQLNNYEFFEVWLDYIEDLNYDVVDKNFEFGEQLVDLYPGKIIFVFRRKDHAAGLLSKDIIGDIVFELSGKDCFFDLDVTQHTEVFGFFGELTGADKSKLIASYHNYQETPSDDELQDIVKQILTWKPTILKISTMCESEMDAVRLLRLLLTVKETGQKCIILGMGQHGAITRIFGTLWGNEMIFAPESSSEQSAPDQLTRTQLETILNICRI